MYSEQDLHGLYDFLRQTNEGNLKKMMVSGPMTDAHLRVLLKVARAGAVAEFVGWVQGESFPKVKWSPAEQAIRETFWPIALGACANLGLINVAKKAA